MWSYESYDMMIISSVNLNWFRCRGCSCRRCSRCCTCCYNFTFRMTIVPSFIWISCITPRVFVTIWTCAIVMLSNDWLVVGCVRPVMIPYLTNRAVLSPTTTWNLWLWNVQTIWVTFFFSSALFWREAIRWEIIIQFAKIVSPVIRVLIIEWTLSRVANVQ